MHSTSRRAVRGIAFVAAAGAIALTITPSAQALDPGANASAFGLSANVLNGTVNVPQTPTSTFPSGGTNSLLNVDLGSLGQVGAVNATTSGDSAGGTSSASGSVANVALLSISQLVAAISADAVDATCSAAAPAAPPGQTTLTNAKLGTSNLLDLHPAANTKLINLTGLAVVTLNEQITSGDGALTVHAIHIQLGPVNSSNVGTLGDVILGSATCGPNAITAPVDAFSFSSTPIIVVGIALVIAVGFAARTGLRRVFGRA
jgi:hypothetical protein